MYRYYRRGRQNRLPKAAHKYELLNVAEYVSLQVLSLSLEVHSYIVRG